MSLRIRGATADLEQAGLETEGMAISTAKLREEVLALTDMKVDIMLNDEEFKSTYQIMEEISHVWKDIADVDQAALLELLGGKRQANILSSMLANFKTAQEALEKSANSAGSAMAENEKYLDSIGGKLKQLEAAWESLSATVLSSELVKGLLDFAIGFIQAIDKMISAIGSIETAVGGAVVNISAKKGIGGIFTAIAKGSGVAEAAMLGLKGGFVGLGIALAAVMGIKVGTWLWDIADSSYNAEKRIKDLSDEVSSLESKESDFTSLAQQFEDLSQATEKTQEYYDVQNQLHDLLPSLRGYYDEHGNYIITETAKVETLIATWKDYLSVLKGQKTDEYLRDPLLGDSAYQNDVDNYSVTKNRMDDIREYTKLNSQYTSDLSSLSETEMWRYYDLRDTFGDIDKANAELRELETTLASITDTLQEHALTAVQATEGWNDLSEEEQSAIDQWIGDLDVSAVQRIIDAYASGSDDLIDQILEQALSAIDIIQQEATKELNPIHIPTLAESQMAVIEDMNTLEEAVNSLGKAYKEFYAEGEITASTLSSLSETFSGCGDEWTDFISLVGSDNMTLSQLDSALDGLITKFIKQQALTGDVTEETKDLLVEMLETIGVVNAEEVALNALGSSLAEVEAEKIAAANPDFYNMSAEEITKLLSEEGATQDVAQALFNLYLAKVQASNGGFLSITKQETAALESLAIAAGNATQVVPIVTRLNAAIDEYNGLLEEQANGGNVTNEMIAEAVDKLYAEQDALHEVQKSSAETADKVDADFHKISDAAKDATDKMKEAFENAYDEIQFLREANLISEEEYLTRLYQLNEQYNKNNLELYRKYQLEIFNGLKSMLSDQINERADAEIKALKKKKEIIEKEYEARIESLEKERDAQEKYYDDLIKVEQERLDQLKDEWDVQDHLLKVEQARAALAAAQSQKNVRLYKDGEGFVWEIDQDAVNNAQDGLNEAIKDYERYQEEKEIQDRIDMLEDAKDEVLDMIDEQIEALEEAKEQALEIIDEQIEAVEEWRDAALKALEDMEMATDEFLKFFKEFGLEMTAEIQGIIDMLDAMAAAAMRAASAMASVGSGGSGGRKSGGKGNESDTVNDYKAGVVWDDKGQSHRWEATVEPDGDRYVDIIAPDGTIISKRYAEGTLSVPTTGMALTDEEGPEIRIPGKGTFRQLHYGDAIIPADVSRNLWLIGAKPFSFAKGIANMISNKTNDNRQNVFNFGDIHLPNVQNAQNFANEFKDIVMKATQLAYSK